MLSQIVMTYFFIFANHTSNFFRLSVCRITKCF